MKKLLSLWVPVVLWGLVIFLFSANPTVKTTEVFWQDFIFKKSAHIIEYAILSLLVYRALIGSGVKPKQAMIYAIITSVLYGVTDEFHQSFTPGREPRLRDVVFDTIGAGISMLLIWKLLPKMPEKLLSLAKKLQLT